MQARIEKVWDESATARTLTLRPGKNWRSFKPGQHVRVGIPIGGRHFTRTYSISSGAESSDGCFTITVKAIPNGFVSNHIVRQLKPGDYIPIGIPQGDFYLPDAQPVKPLFITAGSGITPIMSMLRTLDAEQRFPSTTHIHYAPQSYDVIFGQELQALERKYKRYNLKCIYTRVPGEEQTEEGLKAQHFTKAQLEANCPDWRERDVYACGPQPLLDALEAFWEKEGLRRQLHTERFRATLAPSNVAGQAGTHAIGANVSVMLRPERLQLSEHADPQGQSLQGTLTDLVFQGATARMIVRLADGTELNCLADSSARMPQTAVGATMNVSWDANGGYILAGWAEKAGSNTTDIDHIESTL
jgi:ferredoxin-NADP reductase